MKNDMGIYGTVLEIGMVISKNTNNNSIELDIRANPKL